MTDKQNAEEHALPEFPAQRDDSPYASLEGRGAPPGARQHVPSSGDRDAVARPGGATQNSGGQLDSNHEELGTGPGRGAD
jgi:hypothetical protein